MEPEVKMNLKLKSKHQQLMCHLFTTKYHDSFFILFTIVTIILFMQIRLYGLLRKSNSIAETQLLLTLQLTDLQQNLKLKFKIMYFGI